MNRYLTRSAAVLVLAAAALTVYSGAAQAGQMRAPAAPESPPQAASVTDPRPVTDAEIAAYLEANAALRAAYQRVAPEAGGYVDGATLERLRRAGHAAIDRTPGIDRARFQEIDAAVTADGLFPALQQRVRDLRRARRR